MGLRDRINQNQGLAALTVGAVVVIAISMIVVQVLAGRRGISTNAPDSYFTTDDGRTFFAASSENWAPFDHEGKQAIAAQVFECDGKRFVGYLERYTSEARKTLLSQKHTSPELETYGKELKRPGDTNWIKASDLKAVAKLTDVKCPQCGKMPEPVEP